MVGVATPRWSASVREAHAVAAEVVGHEHTTSGFVVLAVVVHCGRSSVAPSAMAARTANSGSSAVILWLGIVSAGFCNCVCDDWSGAPLVFMICLVLLCLPVRRLGTVARAETARFCM